jgi:peptide methionine sulfoxide reductase msrA/msrB
MRLAEFHKAIDPRCGAREDDASHGLLRTENPSRAGDAHLGHVFDDGPMESEGFATAQQRLFTLCA